MHLLGEGFHTLIPHPYKWYFVLLPSQCGTLQSTPPSGPSVLTGTLSFLQSMWDCHQIHPFGAQRLTSTPPRVYPLQKTTRRLAHRLVSGSDTICNGSDPPLANIVLFGLPFRASPQGFKTRLLGEGFNTLINGILFSSPTNVGHHNFTLLEDQ